LELFSLEEEAAQLPGGLFVFCIFRLGRLQGKTRRRGISDSRERFSDLLRIICCSYFVAQRRIGNLPGEGVMFCDGCGATVQAGQAFCSKCGKQIIGPVAGASIVPNRVQEHVHLLAILWFALSALNTLGGLFFLILGTTLFPHLREMDKVPPDVPVGFLSALFSTIGILILAKAACGFIAGKGLLQRDPWARTVALVLAFISLFNIPFGTAIGVYTMWVLLPGQSQQEYDALVAARARAA
jgi:hypothetical protein